MILGIYGVLRWMKAHNSCTILTARILWNIFPDVIEKYYIKNLWSTQKKLRPPAVVSHFYTTFFLYLFHTINQTHNETKRNSSLPSPMHPLADLYVALYILFCMYMVRLHYLWSITSKHSLWNSDCGKFILKLFFYLQKKNKKVFKISALELKLYWFRRRF